MHAQQKASLHAALPLPPENRLCIVKGSLEASSKTMSSDLETKDGEEALEKMMEASPAVSEEVVESKMEAPPAPATPVLFYFFEMVLDSFLDFSITSLSAFVHFAQLSMVVAIFLS
jgi:hypothetical protein